MYAIKILTVKRGAVIAVEVDLSRFCYFCLHLLLPLVWRKPERHKSYFARNNSSVCQLILGIFIPRLFTVS